MPTSIDVTRFKPMCISNETPTKFIIYISIAPKKELIMNFSNFHIFIFNTKPNISIKKIHAIIVNILFASKVIPPIFIGM